MINTLSLNFSKYRIISSQQVDNKCCTTNIKEYKY